MDPLQNTINFKPKQEVDRNEDMIRRALRAIASLNRKRFSSLLFRVALFGVIFVVWFSYPFLIFQVV